MRLLGHLILIVSAILVFDAHQSKGFDLSLCLGEVFESGCHHSEKSTVNPGSNARKENAEAQLLLKNAYANYNDSVADVEKKLMNTLSIGRMLVPSKPNTAAQMIKQGYETAMDKFLEAGAAFLLDVGKTTALTNNTAKPGLIKASSGIQLVALELFDTMRTTYSMSNETVAPGFNSAIESIDLGRQACHTFFSALYNEIERSYQQAIAAVLVPQDQDKPIQNNDNSAAASKDKEVLTAISEINTTADEAIKKGAHANKVNQLRSGSIRALNAIAKLSLDINLYFTYITQLAETYPSAAKDIYLEKSKNVCNVVQNILSEIFLDYGALSLKSSNETSKQLQNSLKILEVANDEYTVGNKYAKHAAFLGFITDNTIRKLAFTTALQSAKFGKVAVVRKIVEAFRMGVKAC